MKKTLGSNFDAQRLTEYSVPLAGPGWRTSQMLEADNFSLYY